MRRTLVLLVLTTGALAAAPLSASAEDETPTAIVTEKAEGIAAAAAAFESGTLEECLEICAAIPKSSDDYAKAQYLAGHAQLLSDDAESAVETFRALVKSRPKSVPARTGLGQALFAAGEAEEATALLRTVVKEKGGKKDVQALRALGDILAATGEGGEARTLLMKAWRLDTSNPLTAASLVEAHLVGYDDPDSALSVAKKLMKNRPEHPLGPFLKGRALEYDGDWKDAIEAYEKSIELDDTFIDAHRNLAIVCHTQNSSYRSKELFQKCMTAYERYFELGGDDATLRSVYDRMVQYKDWIEQQHQD